jgi:hypothetical protein
MKKAITRCKRHQRLFRRKENSFLVIANLYFRGDKRPRRVKWRAALIKALELPA